MITYPAIMGLPGTPWPYLETGDGMSRSEVERYYGARSCQVLDMRLERRTQHHYGKPHYQPEREDLGPDDHSTERYEWRRWRADRRRPYDAASKLNT
jgi:hypothetical protein